MNNDRERMQQALESLSAMLTHMGMDEDDWNKPTFNQCRKAEAALRERLAQPEQEPVAYIRKDQLQKAAVMAALCEVSPEPRQDRIGIFTNPAPEAKQVEPTVPDHMQDWAGMDGAIAWHLIERHADNWSDVGKMMGEWLAANAAPVQRKPLTEEEIDELAMDKDGLPNSHIEFARAIERAHGIGEKPDAA